MQAALKTFPKLLKSNSLVRKHIQTSFSQSHKKDEVIKGLSINTDKLPIYTIYILTQCFLTGTSKANNFWHWSCHWHPPWKRGDLCHKRNVRHFVVVSLTTHSTSFTRCLLLIYSLKDMNSPQITLNQWQAFACQTSCLFLLAEMYLVIRYYHR